MCRPRRGVGEGWGLLFEIEGRSKGVKERHRPRGIPVSMFLAGDTAWELQGMSPRCFMAARRPGGEDREFRGKGASSGLLGPCRDLGFSLIGLGNHFDFCVENRV